MELQVVHILQRTIVCLLTEEKMNYQLFSLAITIAFIGTLAFPEIDLSNSKYLWKVC